jgi:hypothetical protein
MTRADRDNRLDEMFALQKKTLDEVGSIKRAIYGDGINKVPGLIERQLSDETDIRRLKDSRKKFMWIVAGFVAALQFLREGIINFFK